METLIKGKEAASGPVAITVEKHKNNFRAQHGTFSDKPSENITRWLDKSETYQNAHMIPSLEMASIVIEGVSKVSRLTNCRLTAISSQISAIYIIIFHKTEFQTVILRCWTGLYLNWFKSYDKNEKHRKNAKKPKITKTVHGLFFFLQNCTKTKMKWHLKMTL